MFTIGPRKHNAPCPSVRRDDVVGCACACVCACVCACAYGVAVVMMGEGGMSVCACCIIVCDCGVVRCGVERSGGGGGGILHFVFRLQHCMTESPFAVRCVPSSRRCGRVLYA